MLRNTYDAYGSVAKFFHWLIFFLLFGMVIFGYFLDCIPKDYQPITYNIHKLSGLLIFTLMLLRSVWALTNPKPWLLNVPAWQRIAAHSVHYALYFVVFAMPLVGWIGSSAAGRAPHLGSMNLMLPVPRDEALVDAMFSMHNLLALVLIALVCVHVLAALYHHFIRKDNVLLRMLPSRSR